MQGLAQTPDLVGTQVAVEQAAAATLTAEAPTATNTPTDIPDPTATPTKASSPTPEVTNTPRPTPKPRIGRILFTSNRVSWDDIFVMNDDGTNVKQLTDMGKCYDAHFTPDGGFIVFSHYTEDDIDIWKMKADGSGLVNLTNNPDEADRDPVISPDGKRIAFLSGPFGGIHIYSMKIDGSDRTQLTTEYIDLSVAWSPDSQMLAFSSLRSGSANIWVANRDGSDLRQVTLFGRERIATTPVFSPDGQQIAFTTIAAGTAWEIWAVNLDGSNPHKVVGTVGTDPNNSTYIAAWKKGKYLIGGYQGRWDPYFVPEAGGEPIRLPASEKDDKPSDWWLP